MHKTLNRVFQLDKHTEFGDTADNTVKHMPDKALHILRLFHIVYFPLRIHCIAFPLTCLISGSLTPQLILLHALDIITGCKDITPQHSVNYQIRITPNRRSKMQIIFQCQTEMPDTAVIIACLLHSPQHKAR